ncbi:MAG: DNA polymerase IV [Pseudomonadota bacterium]|nr:DNA polymerase IV [Pseudomonadota bacterium]
MRLIAHLDMDAFYASVELLRYPELRGTPVVIGGGARHAPDERIDSKTGAVVRQFHTLRGYVGRGVITTATYEARALGLHSAQPMMRAAKLAPDAVLLPVDFDAYRACSRRFKAAVRAIAPVVEDRGIDEIYIDLTATPLPGDANAASEVSDTAELDAWTRARLLARAMKQAVREATGLTCSVAVAPNKLLAKIASELDKPDGLTILRSEDIPARIWPLPARKINGVGPKASARLAELGIRTIGELAAADRGWLVERFGSNYGAWLHDAAHGCDEREVVTYSEPKSISRELTFERDLAVDHDREQLSRIFTDLCHGVSEDLRRKGYVGRTIGLKLRYDNFKTVTRDCTIDAPTADASTIRRIAGECLKRVPLERRVRLLGVRVGALVPAGSASAEPPPSVEFPAAPGLFDQAHAPGLAHGHEPA